MNKKMNQSKCPKMVYKWPQTAKQWLKTDSKMVSCELLESLHPKMVTKWPMSVELAPPRATTSSTPTTTSTTRSWRRGCGSATPGTLTTSSRESSPSSSSAPSRAGQGEHEHLSRLPDGKILSRPFLGLRQGGGCGGAIQGKQGIKFCSIV